METRCDHWQSRKRCRVGRKIALLSPQEGVRPPDDGGKDGKEIGPQKRSVAQIAYHGGSKNAARREGESLESSHSRVHPCARICVASSLRCCPPTISSVTA